MTEESAGKLASDAVNALGPSLDDNEQAQELEDILSNPHIGVNLIRKLLRDVDTRHSIFYREKNLYQSADNHMHTYR